METATFVRKQVEAEKQVNTAIAKDLIRIIQSAEPKKMNQLIRSLSGREYNLTAVLIEIAKYLLQGKKLVGNARITEWSDNAIIYGMFFQHTTQLGLKWRDCDRKTALNIKSKTASQTMEIARTGKLSS